MSPADARALLFAGEAERDWAQVEANRRRAFLEDPANGGPECAWVALALDHAYEAFETMLLRFERALALPVRHGAARHRSLLTDASHVILGLRPVIVPPAALLDWLDLLAFRHFLRHAYSAELDPVSLAALRGRLSQAVAETEPAVQAMLAALRGD